ncbi:glycosyltransferase family 4 protein [Tessaracoccus lapidicaptus]|uniref:glycosyltransferase family 4 protein n=1 Tax=Tessaracoccus lapidicaptus TaxID=1427523 RepID=UPI00333F1984
MTQPVALWVAPVSQLAGVSRHVLDVAREGIPGYRLEVAAPVGPLTDALRARGTRVHPVDFSGPPARSGAALRKVVTRVRPRIVHSHLARADFLVAAATVGLPVRLVSTEHGIAGDAQLYHRRQLRAHTRRALHHLRSRRFSALIAVSESTRREMVHAWRPTVRIQVIRNGVDPAATLHDVPGFRFLTLSRLAPEKGLPATVASFAAVARQEPRAELTVAGEGPELNALLAQVRAEGLGHRVRFAGHVDPVAALEAHDVLVQLSAWENASYSILDAVCRGLGVVATPVGGNPEILSPQCLTTTGDPETAASVMLDQAQRLDHRPRLPDGWPSVADMTREIADLYDRLGR